MKFRERSSEKTAPAGGPGPTDAPAGDLGDLRQEGEDFLRAADRAIERALSGDSEKYLRANRQQGGQ